MLFSGKKFRRTHCENIDELLAATNASDDIVRVLKVKAPIVCYTAIDNTTIQLDLSVDNKHVFSQIFKLGEENEMERRDGGKVRTTYTLESDNVLKQVIKMPDGKTAYFTREFNDSQVIMSVTMDGTDICATIYYEVVE